MKNKQFYRTLLVFLKQEVAGLIVEIVASNDKGFPSLQYQKGNL
jgi:hypothetical protein